MSCLGQTNIRKPSILCLRSRSMFGGNPFPLGTSSMFTRSQRAPVRTYQSRPWMRWSRGSLPVEIVA